MLADLEFLKNLMGAGTPEELQKAITASTGFVGYNLEEQAKLMLPLFAGLRNAIPVDKPKQGAPKATWRMNIGYGAYDFGTYTGTAEGGTGTDLTNNKVTVEADYHTQSVKGSVTWEAISQAMGYDDPLSIETSIGLSTLIKHDELNVLGGNGIKIAQVGTVTGNQSTLSSALTFATGTWNVKVTAITLQGSLTNASSNSIVGEGEPSANCGVVVSSVAKDFLDVSWAAIPGAVGYKVYCSVSVGSSTLQLCIPNTDLKYRAINPTTGATDLTTLGDAFTTPSGQTFIGVNHCQIFTAPTSGTALPTGDHSVNLNMFEGLIAWCEKDSIYGASVGTHIKKDMDGAPLTTIGTGISEFDYILQQLWTTWVTSPSKIVTSPAGVTAIGNALVAANSGAMFRLDVTQERGNIVGGLYVGGYVNKFASSMAGMKAVIDVWAHPYMPDGTVLFLSERIPYQYSREGRGFALDVQTPYTYWELARSDRSIPFSIFMIETLKCYHPLAQSSIVGAKFA